MTNSQQLTVAERKAKLATFSVLPELLNQHLTTNPDAIAYRAYHAKTDSWVDVSFKDVYDTVLMWRRSWGALEYLGTQDKVAMLLPNSLDAVYFDQSALAHRLVPVPLHAIDTPKSSHFILNDSEAKVLVTNKALKWKLIKQCGPLPHLRHVVITDDEVETTTENGITVMGLEAFLSLGKDKPVSAVNVQPDDLAVLVYTSGTTGNPKGVMLTHQNIIANICGVMENLDPNPHETMLSFLPLSHTFERTTTYYLCLGMGFTVGFNRSIALLQSDLQIIRPTVLMSVPRVYEMIYGKLREGVLKKPKLVQKLFDWAVAVGWRDFCRNNGLAVPPSAWSWLDPMVRGFLDRKVGTQLRKVFGSRIHFFISGGAPLPFHVAKTFLALGVPIFQGYGMTETSPIISVNCKGRNRPDTVGPALPNLEIKRSDEGELWVKGPSLMRGYWKREDATKAIFTEDGWLKTGDVCEITPDNCIKITGRIKEILVTSSGEKVPPADLEASILQDDLFSQVMAIGDNRPYVSVLAVINEQNWLAFIKEMGFEENTPDLLTNREIKLAVMRRIKAKTNHFPNYGVPRNVILLTEPFTIDNGLLTPTMKMKRKPIEALYKEQIDVMYNA